MKDLLSKLFDSSYELIGIIFPGFGLLCLVGFAVVLALDSLQAAELVATGVCLHGAWPSLLGHIGEESGVGTLAIVLALSYLLGQCLFWFSRNGPLYDKADDRAWPRFKLALRVRVPEPRARFAPPLQVMYERALARFNIPSDPDMDSDEAWRQFYPVAKFYLQQHTTKSLVMTYQNKYTLHRSLTALATIAFWASIAFQAFFVWILVFDHGVDESMFWVRALISLGSIAAAMLLVAVFSGSFGYYWRLFGDSIVTECHSELSGPKPNESGK